MARSFSEEERRRPKKRLTPDAYAALLQELLNGPSTLKELIEASGLSKVTTNQIVLALRAVKLVRICAWQRDDKGCQSIMVFEFAPDKPNVKRPKDPHSVRTKRWRANMKARATINTLLHLGAENA